MPNTATLSSKFKISIPKSIRQERQWEAGQEFVFIPKGDGILLVPASVGELKPDPKLKLRLEREPEFEQEPGSDLEQLAGIAKGARNEDYRDSEDRY
jgi:AbrB family looped-hinge helix DNA binding protein